MDRLKLITAIFEETGRLGKTMMAGNSEAGKSKGGKANSQHQPTRAQTGTLFFISHEGAQSIKQIAEKFQISASAATQLVDSMVKDRLLARKEDKQDRRKIFVDLTLKGKEKLKKARKIRLEKMKKLLQVLSDEELLQLKNIYGKLNERLK
jgi:DNA-binding MarR family transcriptional regulator